MELIKTETPCQEFQQQQKMLDQEKARVEGHEAAIAALFALPHFEGEPDLAEIDRRITIANLDERNWQEFLKRARDTQTCVIVDLERIREHWAGVYAERVVGKVADKLQVVDKRQTLMDLASKDPGAIIDRLKKLGERMARNGEFGPGSRGRDSGDNRGRGSH